MSSRGFSLIELIFTSALMLIVAGSAVPLTLGSVDRSRAAAAASYLAGRLMQARVEAVKRSAYVAVQFIRKPDGFWFRTYLDGNGTGVLAADIARGVDLPISLDEHFEQHFPGITFGICPRVTAISRSDSFDPADPIQIGASTLMSFSPNGSSSGGTLYVRGSGMVQFAIRVLGTTARARTLRFDFTDAQWRSP